jgi:recombination protein RecA
VSEPIVFDHALFTSEAKKQFGDTAIADLKGAVHFGARGTYIPTSSVSLNRALGIGGIPVGRATELFGAESSGKTTLALDVAKHAQAMYPKRPVVYIDSENALDTFYAESIGVDLDKKRFILYQSNEAESALDFAYKAAKAGAGLIIVDSVAALESKDDMEGDDSTKTRVAGIAKPLRAHLRKMLVPLSYGVTVLYLNHITMNPLKWGNPETTPGGKGLPYFASIRMDVRNGGPVGLIKETGEATGIVSKVKVVKNKLAPPFRKCEYDVRFGTGIDAVKDLATIAVADGLFTKSGSWYYLGETKLGQGLDKVIAKLTEEPTLYAEVLAQVAAKTS